MPASSKEVHLVARPVGEPRPTDFQVVEATVDDPGPGQIVVRNDWLSVDPYMRGRMNDVKTYVPPFQLNAPMDGGAVGTVVTSNSADVKQGTTVVHRLGWREYAVLDAADAQVVDTASAPRQTYLGALGMPGLTAYIGLSRIAPVEPRRRGLRFRRRRGRGHRRRPRGQEPGRFPAHRLRGRAR